MREETEEQKKERLKLICDVICDENFADAEVSELVEVIEKKLEELERDKKKGDD